MRALTRSLSALLVLVGVLVPALPAAATTTYTAVQSGAWDDPATWGGSVPQRGTDHVAVRIPSAIGVTIPPGVSVSPFNWDIFIDGFLFNGGSLEIGGSPTLGGRFEIRAGAELWNHGVLRFEDLNSASSSYGKVVNTSSGLMELQGMNAGTLRNDGDLVVPVRATFVNYGVFENRATLTLNRIVARPDIPPGTLKNQGGTVVNTSAGIFTLGGRIENIGSAGDPALIENFGTIDVLAAADGGLGVLANTGGSPNVIDNYGLIQNGNEVDNTGGLIRARCGSLITGNAIVGNGWQNWCDSNAPVLDLPAPINAEATGPDGASVSYHAIAKDDLDPSPVVTCSPASSSTFSLGTTTVSCTATDYVGNSSSGSFSVTIGDTTNPDIDLAGTDSVVVQHNAYSDPGASSSDTVDGDLTGSIVTTGTVDVSQPGIYTIQYSVSDTSGNTSTTTRTVTVVTAAEATDATVEQIDELGLPSSQSDELQRPLERASQLLHDGYEANDQSACRLLDVFIDTARRQQRRGSLSTQQSDLLVEQAGEIKTGIGC